MKKRIRKLRREYTANVQDSMSEFGDGEETNRFVSRRQLKCLVKTLARSSGALEDFLKLLAMEYEKRGEFPEEDGHITALFAYGSTHNNPATRGDYADVEARLGDIFGSPGMELIFTIVQPLAAKKPENEEPVTWNPQKDPIPAE